MTVKINALGLPENFTSKLDRDLRHIFSRGIKDLRFIVLFGSCAKGKYKLGSDLDLLVITDDKLDAFIKGDVASDLDERVEGVSTDVVFYTVTDMKEGKSPFINSIRKEGIVLWKKE